MALEEFTGYITIVPWSLSGITGAGRYYCICTQEAAKMIEAHEENFIEEIEILSDVYLNSRDSMMIYL